MRVAARAVERRINADTSDHAAPTLPCACGQRARYAGRRGKIIESVLGPLALERAYYHCESCEAGYCPRDSALGIEGTSLSPAVTRMVGLVGATVSFAEGHELLNELAGVQVPTKHVERAAEALGREVAEDEKRVVEPLPADEPVAPTLYLGMDGTGVPMRASELVGREGKQPDGSSKTREVKLCTVWSAEGRDEEGTPVRDAGSVSYSAAIESAARRETDEQPSDFAERVMREATRRGFDRAPRRAVLGDSAPWISNLATDHFPDAIQIVDRFHAKQHLSDVGKSIYGATSDLAKAWARQRHDELDAGDVDAILRALAIHAEADDEVRKCVDYVTTNRDRMRYAEFRAMGLCTSTGVVEAGKFAARLRSERDASAPGCTGPWPEQTPSSRCVAASCPGGSRTSGRGALCDVQRPDRPAGSGRIARCSLARHGRPPAGDDGPGHQHGLRVGRDFWVPCRRPSAGRPRASARSQPRAGRRPWLRVPERALARGPCRWASSGSPTRPGATSRRRRSRNRRAHVDLAGQDPDAIASAVASEAKGPCRAHVHALCCASSTPRSRATDRPEIGALPRSCGLADRA